MKVIKYRNSADPSSLKFAATGKIFSQTYFRIDTKGFSTLFDDDKDREAFYADARRVLTTLGFDCEKSPHYAYYDDYSVLHLHPDDIAGVIERSLVPKVHEALEALEETHSFKLRFTEVIRLYEKIDHDELLNRLQSSSELIAHALFDAFTTRNRNSFCRLDDVDFNRLLSSLPGFSLVSSPGKNRGSISGDLGEHTEYARSWVKGLFDGLMESGYLVGMYSNDNPDEPVGVRTINKTEFKKIKNKSDTAKAYFA